MKKEIFCFNRLGAQNVCERIKRKTRKERKKDRERKREIEREREREKKIFYPEIRAYLTNTCHDAQVSHARYEAIFSSSRLCEVHRLYQHSIVY